MLDSLFKRRRPTKSNLKDNREEENIDKFQIQKVEEVNKIFFEKEESKKLFTEWLNRRTTNRFEGVLKIWSRQLNLGIEFPIMIVSNGYPKERMKIVSANGKIYDFQIQYPTPMDDDINFGGKDYCVRKVDGALYTHEFDGIYYLDNEEVTLIDVI